MGTGGGILNLLNSSDEKDFLVFNPDTFWNSNYLDAVKKMSDMYFNYKMENVLMVVHKEKSYDKRLNPDFGIKGNILNKSNKLHIYIGCQIVNKRLFKKCSKKIFSMSEIWNKKLDDNDLYGYDSSQEFIHLTDLEIYNKLLKNN